MDQRTGLITGRCFKQNGSDLLAETDWLAENVWKEAGCQPPERAFSLLTWRLILFGLLIWNLQR